MSLPVPFLDLVALHRELEVELIQVVRESLRTAGFVGGPMVNDFEQAFADFCETKYCVGVGSGTDAVRFALLAGGIRTGDAVLTVPNTFIATAEAISQAGAVPEFIDVDERTSTMAPAKLVEFIESGCECRSYRPSGSRPHGSDEEIPASSSRRSGKRLAAIVPVHLYGQTANMDPILEIANKHRLIVIEDACQAHGAKYFSKAQDRWCRAGSMGGAAAFSFYPGKNLGACGEAGAITTNDEELARTARMLRNHGQAKKYYHDVEGYNGRLDAIQAGFLKAKLKHLADWNHDRREVAARYREMFNSHGSVILPHEPEWANSVYHLFVIRVAQRDDLMKRLAEEGIGAGIHYPIPLHLQKAYAHLAYTAGDFPVAEKVAREIVSLPMYPQLTTTQQAKVVDVVRRFCHERSAAALMMSGH